MQYVRLGHTGPKVSRLCLDCMSYGVPNERWPWALDEIAGRPFIQRALELGITSSLPPMSIQPGAARKCWVVRSRTSPSVTMSSSPPRCIYTREPYKRDAHLALMERLTAMARGRGVSNMQVALAWLLSVVTAPMTGATKMAHLEQAVAALELEPNAAESAALEELYQPRPVAGRR